MDEGWEVRVLGDGCDGQGEGLIGEVGMWMRNGCGR